MPTAHDVYFKCNAFYTKDIFEVLTCCPFLYAIFDFSIPSRIENVMKFYETNKNKLQWPQNFQSLLTF
jgi:hypothetical protein